MKCQTIIDSLEELSPLHYAEEWDNVGLLVGRRDKEVNRVYLAVDATDEILQCAIDAKADMLITHHPLIFKPLKKINNDDFISRRVLSLARNDISYYAMHTNFDVMGMADAAADEIGLKRREVLKVTYEDDISSEGIGRVGRLPRIMSLKECAEYVKQIFNLDNVRVYGDLNAELETAAISPGSGKSMIDDAIRKNVDVLITGDIEHHEGIDAVARGLMIIDASHYGIEKIFKNYIKDYLKRSYPSLTVFVHRDVNPFTIL